MSVILKMAPVQWASLNDIDEVDPIDADDYECLAEIRDVLKRHGKQDRLGVALLHKHFDLVGDEILVEYTDKEARVQTTKPVEVNAAGNLVGTIYQLLDGENQAMAYCMAYCNRGGDGVHRPDHWGR